MPIVMYYTSENRACNLLLVICRSKSFGILLIQEISLIENGRPKSNYSLSRDACLCIALFLLIITPRFCCNYANYIAQVFLVYAELDPLPDTRVW